MAKKRKPRWRPWRRIARYLARRAYARAKARLRRYLDTSQVSRASWDWQDGVNLRPAVQPLHLDRFVAPEDLARFEASLGGYAFWWEMLPDPTADHREYAYLAAELKFGSFVRSLPVDYIEPANEAALYSLPEPITE